jgi:hypothetical protein
LENFSFKADFHPFLAFPLLVVLELLLLVPLDVAWDVSSLFWPAVFLLPNWKRFPIFVGSRLSN